MEGYREASEPTLLDSLRRKLDEEQQALQSSKARVLTLREAVEMLEGEKVDIQKVERKPRYVDAAFGPHEWTRLPTPGSIGAEAVTVLRESGSELTIKEIHKEVERRLGRAIAESTVSAALYKFMNDSRRPKELGKVGRGVFAYRELKQLGAPTRATVDETIASAAHTIRRESNGTGKANGTGEYHPKVGGAPWRILAYMQTAKGPVTFERLAALNINRALLDWSLKQLATQRCIKRYGKGARARYELQAKQRAQ